MRRNHAHIDQVLRKPCAAQQLYPNLAYCIIVWYIYIPGGWICCGQGSGSGVSEDLGSGLKQARVISLKLIALELFYNIIWPIL